MNRYFKTEGNIIYPDRHMLTWGPFYYHSLDNAQSKMEDIMKMVVNWVNAKDRTLNIQPKNLFKAKNGTQIIFDIKAWKDEHILQDCGVIIDVEDIFFEDEL